MWHQKKRRIESLDIPSVCKEMQNFHEQPQNLTHGKKRNEILAEGDLTSDSDSLMGAQGGSPQLRPSGPQIAAQALWLESQWTATWNYPLTLLVRPLGW